MANRPGAKAPNAQRGKPQAKPMGASTGGGLTPAVTPTINVRERRSFGEIIASFPRFISEVRAEARKVTWTSWKETWITSVMVFIMVVVTALFFFVVDGGLRFAIEQLLKLAAG